MTQFLIALDQLLHTLIGGCADETLSAAAYRWALEGKRTWPRTLIDMLFFWEASHCRTAYESEVERRHLPSSYNTQQAEAPPEL